MVLLSKLSKAMKLKNVLCGAALLLPCTIASVYAESDNSERINVGLMGGYHSNSTKFSNLDKNIFPKINGLGSPTFGVYAKFDLGYDRTFALRPEIMFLNRGTKLNDISYKKGTGIGELTYELNASYVDLRLPLIWQIGNVNSVHPYLYVAPIVGFAKGGNIMLSDDVSEYEVEISKANIASTYFAGAVGAGLDIPISVGYKKNINLGIEAMYEYGFTDTYGKKEKDGVAKAYQFFKPYNITGTRKFSGFEVKASISIPLSIFKSSGVKKTVIREERIIEEPQKVVVKEKPCYTLDEILNLISLGQNVSGKRICAIDLINFEFGKSTLTRDSHVYLDKIAALMIRTNASVIVRGHTDNVGSEGFNMNLSKQRAQAVYNYLLSKGVPKDKLSYTYHGMSEPIDTNDTDEGRKNNRRVEFEIY